MRRFPKNGSYYVELALAYIAGDKDRATETLMQLSKNDPEEYQRFLEKNGG